MWYRLRRPRPMPMVMVVATADSLLRFLPELLGLLEGKGKEARARLGLLDFLPPPACMLPLLSMPMSMLDLLFRFMLGLESVIVRVRARTVVLVDELNHAHNFCADSLRAREPSRNEHTC